MFEPQCIRGNCPYCNRGPNPEGKIKECPVLSGIKHQEVQGGGDKNVVRDDGVPEPMVGESLNGALATAIESLFHANGCPTGRKTSITEQLVNQISGISFEQKASLLEQYHADPNGKAFLESLDELTQGA